MSATTIRAIVCASLAVAGFIITLQIVDDHRPPGPAAFCDIRSMNCYDRLGSAR